METKIHQPTETPGAGHINPKSAWVVDPTNYVAHKDWKRIQITEIVGKTLARRPWLKKLKDLIDQFARNKLPILPSITPPLLHLTADIKKPILSLHIAAGNILAGQGKTVIQVITDPHVRDEYVRFAHLPNIQYCVFDQKTKTDFLEKASILGITANPDRVIVTGPPVDPRIIKARNSKRSWRNGPLKICITTGGLGTNKHEMEKILDQLLPLAKKKQPLVKLLVYAGTQGDICDMVHRAATRHKIKISKTSQTKKNLRLLYHPQIVDANELLIKWAFPWADGFITKPSGDMAYDAAASGSFLLTLDEWGEWEHNIQEFFEQLDISRKAKVNHIVEQLKALTGATNKSQSWIEQAMHNAHNLNKTFRHGSENIIKVVKKLDKNT